jgi:CheY-like chemotaxis protein
MRKRTWAKTSKGGNANFLKKSNTLQKIPETLLPAKSKDIRNTSSEKDQSQKPGLCIIENTRILVADDDSDTLETTSNALKAAGYKVLEASTGEECIVKAREDRPDIILLDVILPDIDGVEVCSRIKSDPTLEGTYYLALILIYRGLIVIYFCQKGEYEDAEEKLIAKSIYCYFSSAYRQGSE